MKNTLSLDYRNYIDDAFKNLLSRNPRLSLRALAARASLSPAHLSRVLSGKRSLSVQAAMQLARALEFNEKKTLQFIDLVEYQASTGKNKEALLKKMVAKNSKLKENFLALDKFRLISEWQHFAVLNLFSMKNFQCNTTWIAAQLGLSAPEVRLTLTRLEQAGALSRNADGQLKLADNSEYLSTGDDVASTAIKEHHRQILALATQALDQQAIESREFQSLMLPIKHAQLVKAKERIRDFIEAFNNEFANVNGQDLYTCSVQMFTLTKNNNKK